MFHRHRKRPGMEAFQAVLLLGLAFVVLLVLQTIWEQATNEGLNAAGRFALNVVLAVAGVIAVVGMGFVGVRMLNVTSNAARMAVLELLSDDQPRTYDEVRLTIRRNRRYRWDLMWFFPQYVPQAMAELVREGRVTIFGGLYMLPRNRNAAVNGRRFDGTAVFVCYRRSDSLEHTSRMYDRLVSEFGPNAVYRDLESTPAAVPFPEHVRAALSRVRVILIVIGSQWLTVRDDTGRIRLFDPEDHLRQEVEFALSRTPGEAAVLPILVGEAKMPTRSQLPEPIRTLAEINALRVRPDPDFHDDMGRLIGCLRELLGGTADSADRPPTTNS